MAEMTFNGAMTSQPWIRGGAVAAYEVQYNLQWSHDLSAMDTSGSGCR